MCKIIWKYYIEKQLNTKIVSSGEISHMAVYIGYLEEYYYCSWIQFAKYFNDSLIKEFPIQFILGQSYM